MLILGAHMPAAGGLSSAVKRAAGLKIRAMQLFTKNTNQWNSRPISKEEAAAFRKARKDAGIISIAVHDSYLINIATPNRALYEKSKAALKDEIKRAAQIGADYLILHPGSHMGLGSGAACKQAGCTLRELHMEEGIEGLSILVETTAGQGSQIGRSFEELADILEKAGAGPFGVCFDTSHVFAAGYDIRTGKEYHAVFESFEKLIGLRKIKAFHLNDSKAGLGARVDRHEHIGKGHLGLEAFKLLLNDLRFDGLPGILETPKGKDLQEDRMNLAMLSSLFNGIRKGVLD